MGRQEADFAQTRALRGERGRHHGPSVSPGARASVAVGLRVLRRAVLHMFFLHGCMQWQRRCVSTSVCMLAFRWGQHVCVTSSRPLGQAPGGVHGARPAADIAINSGGRAAGAALAGGAGAAARSGDHGVDARELVGAGARGGLAGGRASSHGRCNRALIRPRPVRHVLGSRGISVANPGWQATQLRRHTPVSCGAWSWRGCTRGLKPASEQCNKFT